MKHSLIVSMYGKCMSALASVPNDWVMFVANIFESISWQSPTSNLMLGNGPHAMLGLYSCIVMIRLLLSPRAKSLSMSHIMIQEEEGL